MLCILCVIIRLCFLDAFSDHGEDETPTEGMFLGHQEAVNALQIHNGLLYTCSGDRTIRAFDLMVGDDTFLLLDNRIFLPFPAVKPIFVVDVVAAES